MKAAEFAAPVACAPILPDNPVVDRSSCCAFPYDCSFTLVGEPDRSDIRCADFLDHVGKHRSRCLEQFDRIMLDPAGTWKMLGKFFI
jgi:hypothetical protein